MEFIDKKFRVYKKEHDNRVTYSIGVSKKKQDGSYENGYIPVRFRKDITVADKTDIIIKEGWIDFFKVEKKTIMYYFINKFEMSTNLDAMKQVQEPKEKTYLEQSMENEETEYPFY